MPETRQVRVEAHNDDRVVHVLDSQSGMAMHDLTHPDTVWSVAISADSRQIATGCRDTIARLWNAQTGGLIRLLMKTGDGMPAHYGYVWSVAFSPDGRHVATGGYDGRVRLWSIDGGGEEASFEFVNHTLQNMPGLLVSFSADGRHVLGKLAEEAQQKAWPVPSIHNSN